MKNNLDIPEPNINHFSDTNYKKTHDIALIGLFHFCEFICDRFTSGSNKKCMIQGIVYERFKIRSQCIRYFSNSLLIEVGIALKFFQ